ncbi:27162_t:CDS:1, partial [Racocetra persica]
SNLEVVLRELRCRIRCNVKIEAESNKIKVSRNVGLEGLWITILL